MGFAHSLWRSGPPPRRRAARRGDFERGARSTAYLPERIEAALGEERDDLFEGAEEDWERQPLPDGPLTVGIDGGFVKAAQKQGFFEVIAGKSVLAFRRDDQVEKPSSKCFSVDAARRAPAASGPDEGSQRRTRDRLPRLASPFP